MNIFLAINDIDYLKEAWWLYAIGCFIAIFIIGGSVFFALKAYKQSKKLGMPKAAIKKTVISSISFSVLPSIGIFIGVITMSGLHHATIWSHGRPAFLYHGSG